MPAPNARTSSASSRRLLGGDGDPEALARLVLSAAERAVLAAVPPEGQARAFLVAWTRKEAVTKATGDGLIAAFSDVVAAADACPPRWCPGLTRGLSTA